MKTAFEESQSAIFDIATRSGILRVEFEREIQRIQLDAAKWGAEQAANIIPQAGAYGDLNSKARKEVLNFATNLTIDQLLK